MSEHKPSDYEATLNLTYQEMWELQKAISQRMVTLIKRDEMFSDEMVMLTQVNEIIDKHVTIALEEWEANVAKNEAQALDNEDEVRKFFGDRLD